MTNKREEVKALFAKAYTVTRYRNANDAKVAINEATDAIMNLFSGMVSEWQPIETAPRDGSVVLLTCKTALLSRGFEFGRYGVNDTWWNASVREPVRGQPTHWMPLPSPPGDRPMTNPMNDVNTNPVSALDELQALPRDVKDNPHKQWAFNMTAAITIPDVIARIRKLEEENLKLRSCLKDSAEAIYSLPNDALGLVYGSNPYTGESEPVGTNKEILLYEIESLIGPVLEIEESNSL